MVLDNIKIKYCIQNQFIISLNSQKIIHNIRTVFKSWKKKVLIVVLERSGREADKRRGAGVCLLVLNLYLHHNYFAWFSPRVWTLDPCTGIRCPCSCRIPHPPASFLQFFFFCVERNHLLNRSTVLLSITGFGF